LSVSVIVKEGLPTETWSVMLERVTVSLVAVPDPARVIVSVNALTGVKVRCPETVPTAPAEASWGQVSITPPPLGVLKVTEKVAFPVVPQVMDALASSMVARPLTVARPIVEDWLNVTGVPDAANVHGWFPVSVNPGFSGSLMIVAVAPPPPQPPPPPPAVNRLPVKLRTSKVPPTVQGSVGLDALHGGFESACATLTVPGSVQAAIPSARHTANNMPEKTNSRFIACPLLGSGLKQLFGILVLVLPTSDLPSSILRKPWAPRGPPTVFTELILFRH